MGKKLRKNVVVIHDPKSDMVIKEGEMQKEFVMVSVSIAGAAAQ